MAGSRMVAHDLRGWSLRRADLAGAWLSGSDLTGADLRDADLRDADLTGAVLTGADLRGADLSGAELHGADLRGTVLTGASLRNSRLTQVRYDSSTRWPAGYQPSGRPEGALSSGTASLAAQWAGIFWAIGLAVLCMDQLTKYLAESMLPAKGLIELLPGLLALAHQKNPGVTLGALAGSGPGLALLQGALVAAVIGYQMVGLRHGAPPRMGRVTALALITGGGLGNFIDRIRLGEVTDFLMLGASLVVNLADLAIIGGILLYASAWALDIGHMEESAAARDRQIA